MPPQRLDDLLLNPRKTKISKSYEFLNALELMEGYSSPCANYYFWKDRYDKLVISEVNRLFSVLALVKGQITGRKLWLMHDVNDCPPKSFIESIVSFSKDTRKFIEQLNQSKLPFIELLFRGKNLLIWFLEFWVNLINVLDQLFFLVSQWVFELLHWLVNLLDFLDQSLVWLIG